MGKGGYGTIAFWEEWYEEEDHRDRFDWLLDYDDIGPMLDAVLGCKHEASILITGCGNSSLSSELFGCGYRNLLSIDNCPCVVSAQRLRYPMLTWEVRDVRETGYESNSFDFVLDKGCLDNLYCYLSAEENVHRYLREVCRLLRPGGRFFVVSCYGAQTTTKSLDTCRDLWSYASREIPNPRYPHIRIETYQIALCQLLLHDEKEQDLDALLLDAITVPSPSSLHPTAAKSSSTPARVDHLERRSSGLRHSSLIVSGSTKTDGTSFDQHERTKAEEPAAS